MPDTETKPYFKPFEEIFLPRRDEIMQLVGITRFALSNMQGIAELSEVLKYSEQRIDKMKELEAQARHEVDRGFPLLHNSAAILIWSALETSVVDFCVFWLEANPNLLLEEAFHKTKISIAEYQVMHPSDRMRYLVRVLEQEKAAPQKPGVGRFDVLLKPLHVKAKIEPSIRKTLNELSAVRNVLVHRAGKIDQRFLDLCPWSEGVLNSQISISSKKLEDYIGACSQYCVGIIHSARDYAGEDD